MARKRSLSAVGITLLIGTVTVMAVGEACVEPTQMTLDIRFHGGDCSDIKNVVVLVGNDPSALEKRAEGTAYPTAVAEKCENGSFGTLAITPKEDSDRGAVMVIAGVDDIAAETCKPSNGYLGCIVARRQFTFVEHRALTLPVVLERTCANVPCNVNSSCIDGRCGTSQTACRGDDCIDWGGTLVPSAPTRPPAADSACAPSSKPLDCGQGDCTGGQLCCAGSRPASFLTPKNGPIIIPNATPDASGSSGLPDVDAGGTSSSGGSSSSTSSTSSSGGSSTSSTSSSSGGSSSGGSSSGGSSSSSTSSSGGSSSAGSSSSSSSGGAKPPPIDNGAPVGACGTCTAGLACLGRSNCTADKPNCCIVPGALPSAICQAAPCTQGDACQSSCDCPDKFVCPSASIPPYTQLHKCVPL